MSRVERGSPTSPEQRESTNEHRWRVLALCLLAGFMTLLDVSIVNVALPSIQHGLEAPHVALSWVVSGYALTFGLVLVPMGKLGDAHGRGRMFLVALALFTLASALAGMALNPLWLVLARLLQGAAGGMLNPQVIGLIQQQFHGRERGTAFGMFGAVVGLSTAVGPLLGGLIIELAGVQQGWRWVFFVNIPIGVIALLAALRFMPRSRGSAELRGTDLPGVLLLGSGTVCLLLPLVDQQDLGRLSWLLWAAAPVLLALFVGWEYRYTNKEGSPLIDLRLFRISSYSFGSALGMLYFAGFTGIFFVLAVYFQRGLGYSALQAGLALTPFAVGSAVSSAFSGRAVHRMGRRVVLLGLSGALLGLLATQLLLAGRLGHSAGMVTALPLLVAGVGSGMVISPNQTVTLSGVEVTRGGTAAGVQQTGQRIGTAIGTATASGLFFSQLPGDYDVAISHGLVASVCFVAAAMLVGLAELTLCRQR